MNDTIPKSVVGCLINPGLASRMGIILVTCLSAAGRADTIVLDGHTLSSPFEVRITLVGASPSFVRDIPVPVQQRLPDYSISMRKELRSGAVRVRLRINEAGEKSDVRIVKQLGGGDFGEAVMKVAREWTFRPGVASNGTKIPITLEYEVVFTSKHGEEIKEIKDQ